MATGKAHGVQWMSILQPRNLTRCCEEVKNYYNIINFMSNADDDHDRIRNSEQEDADDEKGSAVKLIGLHWTATNTAFFNEIKL